MTLYILIFCAGLILSGGLRTAKARRIIAKLRSKLRKQEDEILWWVGEFIRACGPETKKIWAKKESLKKTLEAVKDIQPPPMTLEYIERCNKSAHELVTRLTKEKE